MVDKNEPSSMSSCKRGSLLIRRGTGRGFTVAGPAQPHNERLLHLSLAIGAIIPRKLRDAPQVAGHYKSTLLSQVCKILTFPSTFTFYSHPVLVYQWLLTILPMLPPISSTRNYAQAHDSEQFGSRMSFLVVVCPPLLIFCLVIGQDLDYFSQAGFDMDRISIKRNAPVALLYEDAIRNEGAIISSSGALINFSGKKTGRLSQGQAYRLRRHFQGRHLVGFSQHQDG